MRKKISICQRRQIDNFIPGPLVPPPNGKFTTERLLLAIQQLVVGKQELTVNAEREREIPAGRN